MKVRADLVRTLRNEVLGPRGGAEEMLHGIPSFEYIVGIIEPLGFKRDSTLNTMDSSETKPFDLYSGEIEEEDPDLFDPIPLGSSLDPRAFAKSCGISFILDGKKPVVSICVTYGTYTRISDSPKSYKRTPHLKIIDNHRVIGDEDLFTDDYTRLRIFTRKHKQFLHVSLHLVNCRKTKSELDYIPVEDLVFQPQIRVLCEGDTVLVPVEAKKKLAEDEKQVELLFHDKTAYARGHMCSAMWREADPEASNSDSLVNPYPWDDGMALRENNTLRFIAPSLRTEFLPVALVEQVDMQPDVGSTELSAAVLSETWSFPEMRNLLLPLAQKYEEWLEKQRSHQDDIEESLGESAEKNLRDCEAVLSRIRGGIDTLADDNVRLSFCFMNKVMDIQSIWRRGAHGGLSWRPFQLAFILSCIPSIVNPDDENRRTCDVLWFPTGGGKTEAYLGLAIFTIAYRRRALHGDVSGIGTAVISRYTLRLLTVQQFRRTLSAITAAELLRVRNWRPAKANIKELFLWGVKMFSAGLWVGSEVTPNRIAKDGHEPSAISVLTNMKEGAEPAQVLRCPACDAILALTDSTIGLDEITLYLLVKSKGPLKSGVRIPASDIEVTGMQVTALKSDYYLLELKLKSNRQIKLDDFEEWWRRIAVLHLSNCEVVSACASRPGYFIRRDGPSAKPCDFEIHCLNPNCELSATTWFELLPDVGDSKSRRIVEPFKKDQNTLSEEELRMLGLHKKMEFQNGICIPAYTVDDQVYHRLPSIIIATADKFARLPYEPFAGNIFGNVNRYDPIWGFYRYGLSPDSTGGLTARPLVISRLRPPDLVIQDELHLIDGPLGSMVGIYETAIDYLMTTTVDGKTVRSKYIASSATIRHADSQVKATYDREIALFPPQALAFSDSFFSREIERNWLDSARPGRLYIGLIAPGKGAQTPVVRVWSAIMQGIFEIEEATGIRTQEIDNFSTLVGYFNSMRELANVRSLYRQDIISQIAEIARRRGTKAREIPETRAVELSSRMESSRIPDELRKLEKSPNNEVDAVMATSMFGTGVDVDRLGLMVVHGQPKTTSSYIQSTGRVGRQLGGLVVTILRSSRPRDLDHYEFFVGYHNELLKYVEPITVFPFSSRALERAAGPVSVALLRNMYGGDEWARETGRNSGPIRMASERDSQVVSDVEDIIIQRSQKQPFQVLPRGNVVEKEVKSEIDKWQREAKASSRGPKLVYVEYSSKYREISDAVVLGDPAHSERDLPVVFDNAPQSMREVESTTTFGVVE